MIEPRTIFPRTVDLVAAGLPGAGAGALFFGYRITGSIFQKSIEENRFMIQIFGL